MQGLVRLAVTMRFYDSGCSKGAKRLAGNVIPRPAVLENPSELICHADVAMIPLMLPRIVARIQRYAPVHAKKAM